MRSSPVITLLVYIIVIVTFRVNDSFANPVEPMPVTRLFWQDSLHWLIEIDARELSFSSDLPDRTDLITLACEVMGFDFPPMQSCAKTVYINTDSGTGMITPEHFPGLKIRAGETVFIGTDKESFIDVGPTLPERLTPNTSIALFIENFQYCEVMNGQSICYPYTRKEYRITECQNFQTGNGVINGILMDMQGHPLPSFAVACLTDLDKPPVVAGLTKEDGSFQLGRLDTCPVYLLKFYRDTLTAEYLAGPISFDPYGRLDLSIKIHIPPTEIEARHIPATGTSSVISLLPSSGTNGNPILLTISDNSLKGKGDCTIFAVNGEVVRSMHFNSRGTGTYTINWSGTDENGSPVPAAAYLCRITIGRETVCKSFVTRQD